MSNLAASELTVGRRVRVAAGEMRTVTAVRTLEPPTAGPPDARAPLPGPTLVEVTLEGMRPGSTLRVAPEQTFTVD